MRASSDADYSFYFVGGLQKHISTRDVEKYFEAYGPVEKFIPKHDNEGRSRGFGWVQFRQPVRDLIQRGPHLVHGVQLTVELSQARNVAGSVRRPQVSNHSSRRRDRSRSYSPSSRSSSRTSTTRTSGKSRRYEQPQTASFAAPASSSDRVPVPNSFASQSASISSSLPSTNGQVPMMGNTPVPGTPVCDLFVCIPAPLCPPEFLNDPRTFCARLDHTRIGSLTILQQVSAAAQTGVPVASSAYALASQMFSLQNYSAVPRHPAVQSNPPPPQPPFSGVVPFGYSSTPFTGVASGLPTISTGAPSPPGPPPPRR